MRKFEAVCSRVMTFRHVSRLLWVLVAVMVAFALGYIHHRWFYPLFFHGDAAAMHILGNAIYDEISLLPQDFYYGNQLVFLRSSPFIALAKVLGSEGYDSFAVGSALSIGVWGGVLFGLLRMYVSSLRLSLALMVALLIPLGPWDVDFFLGQQSHLANAILALGMALGVARYAQTVRLSSLAVAAVCLFLMSAEAPIRGLLVWVPLLVAAYLFTSRERLKCITWVTGSVFAISFLINKLLVGWRPTALNHFTAIRLNSTDEILENLLVTTLETIHSVTVISFFDGAKLTIGGLIALVLGLLILGAYAFTIIYGLRAVVGQLRDKLYPVQHAGSDPQHSTDILVVSTAALGFVVGALAVATLNPDSSRHYFWVIFVLKFCVLKWLFDRLQMHFHQGVAIALPLLVCLLASVWMAQLGKHIIDLDQMIESKISPAHVKHIKRISTERDIHYVYGEDFWRMMPLNSLIPGIESQALLADGDELVAFKWLARPSWSCPRGPVMFFLKDGPVDQIIERELVKRDGQLVHQGEDYTLWIGTSLLAPSPRAQC